VSSNSPLVPRLIGFRGGEGVSEEVIRIGEAFGMVHWCRGLRVSDLKKQGLDLVDTIGLID